jgi:hypothetical protein
MKYRAEWTELTLHSTSVGFGDLEQKQILTCPYHQPTDIHQDEYFGGIQSFPKTRSKIM